MLDRARLVALICVVLAVTLTIESYVRLRAANDESIATEIESLDFLSMQIRRVLANIVWMRLDDYLHSADVLVFTNVAGSKEKVSGVSARAVANELYPLARLVTLLDPSFVRAGIAVGGLLLRETAKEESGSNFLRGLIRSNPDHPRLYALYAIIGMNRWARDDFKGARPYLEKALELYPRVKDTPKLLLFGDQPADESDDSLRRNVLVRLVHSVTMLEDYDAAIHWWRQSEGFDPRNKVVRILMMYRRMKAQGKVDREELAAEMAKLAREEQERAAKIGQEQSTTDAPADVEEKKTPGQDAEYAQSSSGTGIRTQAQAWTYVNLGLPTQLAIKLLVVISLTGIMAFLGRRRGWLQR
jgi:tetratricopeptide (TPR) repeat protein